MMLSLSALDAVRDDSSDINGEEYHSGESGKIASGFSTQVRLPKQRKKKLMYLRKLMDSITIGRNAEQCKTWPVITSRNIRLQSLVNHSMVLATLCRKSKRYIVQHEERSSLLYFLYKTLL